MERSEKRDDKGRDTISTIGPGVTITGDVRCATLFLGETGRIEGTIEAERVRVSGKVDGSISAGDLAVEPTAHVKGDIVYSRLKVSAGGVIEGNLSHRAASQSMTDNANLKLVEAAEPAPRRVYSD